MPFEFRPAKRESVHLLIGVSGPSGSGKTWSAMVLAKGLAGAQKFAVIDTENRRASMYADYFQFDAGDLAAPFTPDAYLHAIQAADKAGYPVIVVDSMSHEWAGDGGCLDMQESELDRMAGQDYGKRDACKMASWIKPKAAHKSMMAKLLQVNAHVILCFRAEAKIEMVKGAGGRMEVREKKTLTSIDGWIPISEKNLPFELTASFLLMPDRPGVPRPIKLQEQHKPFFRPDKPIDEESGRLMAAWARGGSSAAATPPAELLDEEDIREICDACDAAGVSVEQVIAQLKKQKIDGMRMLPKSGKQALLSWIESRKRIA